MAAQHHVHLDKLAAVVNLWTVRQQDREASFGHLADHGHEVRAIKMGIVHSEEKNLAPLSAKLGVTVDQRLEPRLCGYFFNLQIIMVAEGKEGGSPNCLPDSGQVFSQDVGFTLSNVILKISGHHHHIVVEFGNMLRKSAR
jgi:hypothetical protein